MPGRRPKPTALKALAGNPGKRPLNHNEPKFTGKPKCPPWLTDAAKAEWRRVMKELEALDMLRSVDSASLAAYCVAFANWMRAEAIVQAEGQIVHESIVNKAGDIVGTKSNGIPPPPSHAKSAPRW